MSEVGIFLNFSYLGLVFQVLKVLKVRHIKICKIEPPDLLFLAVFISFYISWYRFSQIFRTPFGIIRKKDFRHEFSFLTDSPPFHLGPVFWHCFIDFCILVFITKTFLTPIEVQNKQKTTNKKEKNEKNTRWSNIIKHFS